MRSWFHRLFALAFVPIFVVITPTAVQAAVPAAVPLPMVSPDRQTTGVAWEFHGASYGYGTISCSGEAFIEPNNGRAFGGIQRITCESRADVSPGFAQPGEAGSNWTVWIEGANCGGSESGEFSAHPDDSWTNEIGYTLGASWDFGPDTCDPVCAGLTISGAGSRFSLCTPVALDAPVETPGPQQCAAGSVDPPQLGQAYLEPTSNNREFTPLHVNIVPQGAGPASDWLYYTIQSSTTGQPGAGTGGMDGFLETGQARLIPAAAYAPGAFQYSTFKLHPMTQFGWVQSVQTKSRQDRPDIWSFPVIGVGVVHRPTFNAANGQPPSGTSYVEAGVQVTPQENMVGNASLAGTTNLNECVFYWGAKVASTNGNDEDEPIGQLGGGAPGPVPDPYVPEPDDDKSCEGFSFNDPSTWGGQAFCMMVGLLGQIVGLLQSLLGLVGSLLSAIAGLAGAIVSGIGSLLESLFIPSDGFLDNQLSNLSDDMEDSQPGSWLSAFTDQDFGIAGTSNCSGIPVEWTMSGQTNSFALGEACSGFMATTASVVKLAASALLVIFGAIACLRGLGAGFGWSPSVGRGAEV